MRLATDAAFRRFPPRPQTRTLPPRSNEMACRVSLVQIPLFVLMAVSAASAAGVKVRFDPASPGIGPYPSDALTVADAAQKTGLRMNLPMPDCVREPSTCQELALINQIDGFSLKPRLRVRFSAAVNPDTLKHGIVIYWLNPLTSEEQAQPFGTLMAINKIEYDPSTNTAYAEPDQLLAQDRRYALLVTSAVEDAKGDPVEVDSAFLTCIQQPGAYCDQVAMAIGRAAPRLAPRNIVAASVFTTMSATASIEKARAAIQTSSIGLATATPKAVFNVAAISKLILHAQRSSAKFADIALPGPDRMDGVGQIAFGSIQSPFFLNHQLMIPAVPTARDVALPAVANTVVFTAFLPATPPPPGGYPVVVFAQGSPGDGFPGAAISASMAARGLATVAITALGHGFGPQTTLQITDKTGGITEISRPGRGMDIDGNGLIDSSEGCIIPTIGSRDCFRQTALDTLQLIRAIQAGIDLDGDGTIDLDGSHISFAGFSFGASIGPLVAAVEPAIESVVLTAAAGTTAETTIWSPAGHRLAVMLTAMRQPPLLNLPGPDFDGEFTLRNQSPRIIGIPGAVAIQEFVERFEWITMTGEPLAFAPHLKSSMLPHVAPKRLLLQYAIGDLSSPNPFETAFARAANAADMVSIFRQDLAPPIPGMPLNPDPHMFAFDFTTSKASVVVARAAQAQMAMFLAGSDRGVPYVNDMLRWPYWRDLFEVPEVLPEDLNF
ncbi:MAG: hypothetical protein JST11_16510 [Acidobacteria bacterium]|nr:hypothetical protein [Acidobacteriota bacterium]